MEVRIPKKGDIYRHFKGNLYEVIIIARDSETLEEKVVYKDLNGEAAYVRALPMFVSLVDKEKYPNVTQEYRFEYLESFDCSAEERVQEESELEDRNLIMGFLEQNSIGGKISFLQNHKSEISEAFLEIVAQSLDFVEKETTLQKRYEEILRYLLTLDKYENGRFR